MQLAWPTPGVMRRALMALAATSMVMVACRPVPPAGGRRVNVQQAVVGVTLQTDRHNTVTVTEYRSAVPATKVHASAGSHFEAAELRICARVSGGSVDPSIVTLITVANTRVQPSGATPLRHALGTHVLKRGKCARGWVAFEVPDNNTGARVVVVDNHDDSLRWVVP